MNIFRLLGELLAVYILYQVIFNFIIPLYKSTKEIKSKMKDVQERMQEQQRGQAAQQKSYGPEKVPRAGKPEDEEYIDYEEVK